jgi:ATP synthase protein I
MFRVVAAQFVTSLFVSAGSWVIAGRSAAASSLLGGLACTVPNGLFALNLAQVRQLVGSRAAVDESGAGSSGAAAVTAALLVGEFLKVVLTVGLLMLIAWAYKDLVWLALIAAVIAVLWMQAAALVWR